jgi:hypothetical protein
MQLAVKQTAIGAKEFLWSAWTDFDLAQSGLFDYNDSFTLQEAGSPYAANPNYPLKKLYGIDNTCRIAYGFTPLGSEPGLCGGAAPTRTPATAIPQHPTVTPVPPPPAQPGSINGLEFFDNNANGFFDAGDEGRNDFELRLYQNATCSGSPYLGARPASDGNYNLTNLAAGTWCLRLETSYSVLPGNPQPVNVPAGGAATVNFAIQGPG